MCLLKSGLWCQGFRVQVLILEVLSVDQDDALTSVSLGVFLLPQVCLTGCSRDLMVRVDQLCSQRNIKVFCGDVYGYYGYMFSNLGKEHNYVE